MIPNIILSSISCVAERLWAKYIIIKSKSFKPWGQSISQLMFCCLI